MCVRTRSLIIQNFREFLSFTLPLIQWAIQLWMNPKMRPWPIFEWKVFLFFSSIFCLFVICWLPFTDILTLVLSTDEGRKKRKKSNEKKFFFLLFILYRSSVWLDGKWDIKNFLVLSLSLSVRLTVRQCFFERLRNSIEAGFIFISSFLLQNHFIRIFPLLLRIMYNTNTIHAISHWITRLTSRGRFNRK